VTPIHQLLEKTGMKVLLTRARGKWVTLLAQK
jgi:hypothetical protein